ncbi:MAG: dTDP-4-dehydrorhamnose reductase [Thermoanaerobaculia bacterium]
MRSFTQQPARVLITGAGGLIASALVSCFDDVYALRHAALDITDASAVDNVFERLEPALVINCAVVGVDECESDPALATRMNVGGPVNLARAAARTGAAIVHFSSNYVFRGRESPPYTIEDVPEPVNVYGETKLAGERAVRDTAERAFIVRTSWVYGPAKDSFLSTAAAKLKRGERVQAISDTWANSTFVNDLAERVRAIVGRGVFGTYQIVNEGLCSYETFAREAASIVGASSQLVDVVTEASMRRRAPRPSSTPMRCLLSERLGFAPMRPWQDALRDYARSSR